MSSPEQTGERLLESIQSCLPEQLPTPIILQASEGCEVLVNDAQFVCILAELINNCAEKPVEGIEVQVSIGFDQPANIFHMIVEDNVKYQPKEAQKILHILNKKRRIRTANKRPELMKCGEFGTGIVMIRNFLSKHKGSLHYLESDDHRIVAEAKWKK